MISILLMSNNSLRAFGPNFFLHKSSGCGKIRLYTENQLPEYPQSGCKAMHEEEEKRCVLTMASYTGAYCFLFARKPPGPIQNDSYATNVA